MNYFLPLAYDRIDPIKGTGKGTIARCDVLIEKARAIKDPNSCVFVATAGYTKESPRKPIREVQVSLATQIWRQVYEKGFGRHIIRPEAWGTLDEVRAALYEISSMAVREQDQSPEIYISTNFGHMPRVRLCVWFLKGRYFRNWSRPKFHFVTAPHSFSPKEWVQETVKFFVYLYRFLF